MMTKEQIKEKYPDLFDECWDFSVGKGWLPLVSSFCFRLNDDINWAFERLEIAEKCIKEGKYLNIWEAEIEDIREKVEHLKSNYPKILQIKEKFGGMDINCKSLPEGYLILIKFIRDMSYKTCEFCGVPAEVRISGWIKTSCTSCAKELGREYKIIGQDYE